MHAERERERKMRGRKCRGGVEKRVSAFEQNLPDVHTLLGQDRSDMKATTLEPAQARAPVWMNLRGRVCSLGA